MPIIQLPSTSSIQAHGLAGGAGWLAYDLTDSQYRDAFTQYSVNAGFALTDLWGYSQGDAANTPLYAATWEECRKHPAQYSQHQIAFNDFQTTFNTQLAQGYAPVRICGYAAGTQTMFAAIWQQSAKSTQWNANHQFDLSELDAHVQNVITMGYRITDLNAYMLLQPNPADPTGPQIWTPKFSSIWVPNDGRAWKVSAAQPFDAFIQNNHQLFSQGWYPVQFTGYGVQNASLGIGRWEKQPTTPDDYWISFGSAAFQYYLAATDQASMRSKSISPFSVMLAEAPPSYGQSPAAYLPIAEKRTAEQVIPPLAAEFLRNYAIPGLSLAVARQGQLVYAGGFGTANKATGDAVTTTSRFRIASLSKPITATMIFLMIDRKQLFLDDLVFGPNGKLASFGQPVDPRVNQITIHHLLQHAGGGWANDENDPMYTHPELANPSDLVKKVIATRPLDNTPGTAYAYSNFGYCVLGRVIEAAIGFTYPYDVSEDFMGQLPGYGLGMSIGANTLAERQSDEVVYYPTNDGDPYKILVSRMDSHGGWVGTATDYLRFMVRADGLPTVPDLLTANSTTLMTTPSGLPNSNGYACGWGTASDGTWSHTGVLAGSRSIMVRTADGYCWAALANSGTTASKDPTVDTNLGLDALMWAIRDKVDFWPASTAL